MSTTMSRPDRNYSAQELAEVLRRVQRAERTSGGAPTASAPREQEPGLSRSELLETAREVGYDERQVSLALIEYEEDRRLAQAAGELRQLSYRRFSGHLIVAAVVNAMLAATGVWAGSPLWLVLVMVLWGALLLSHLRGVVFPDPDQLRERARTRLARQRLKQSSRELGQALSHGAAKLMSATAKKIDTHIDRL